LALCMNRATTKLRMPWTRISALQSLIQATPTSRRDSSSSDLAMPMEDRPLLPLLHLLMSRSRPTRLLDLLALSGVALPSSLPTTARHPRLKEQATTGLAGYRM
jgi:hypothetical protein